YANQIESLKKNLSMLNVGADQMDAWQRELIEAEGEFDTANQTVAQYNQKLAELEALLKRLQQTSSQKPLGDRPVSEDVLKSFSKLAISHNAQIIALELGARAQYEYKLSQEEMTEPMRQTLLAQYDYIESLKTRQKAEKDAADAKR
ncbi:hypothetical protein BTA35_0216850, partial [Oceanospirillum linum]